MSDRTVTAIVTAGVGIAILIVVRWLVKHGFERYLRRLETRRSPDEVASLRTRLSVLLRVGIVFLGLILAWQVLSIYEETDRLANAVLASGAVIALFVGLAFSTPLSNLGAGILLAFSQPVRIGDRVTVGEVTGMAEQITLIHTVLVSDDDRRVFIPNSQMVSSVVINRSVVDPRRTVTIELPIALTVSLERAKGAVLAAARTVSGGDQLDLHVGVATVGDRTGVAEADGVRAVVDECRRPRRRPPRTGARSARARAAPARVAGRASMLRPVARHGRRSACHHGSSRS